MAEVAFKLEIAEDHGQDPLFTLVETIEALSMARTVEQVAAVVRSSARRITGADGVAFVLRDAEQCWYLDEDAIGPLWKGKRFPLTACISGWAMLNKQTVVVPDIYQDDRIPHDAYRPTFVKSLVMTPVRPEDPIAAIGAYWSVERQPSQDEIVKLQVMARATATALESARVYASLHETLERRKFLLRELDHRCKNQMAAVQSIAQQTLRKAPTPADFVDAFTGRLGAMARAHELLTREQWGLSRLGDVLAAALEPHGGVDGRRIRAEGPEIALAPETSMTFLMTFHELTTNAVKYGALSADGGTVEIAWSVDMAADPRELALTWRERGGPEVAPADRAGFGSRVLQGGIARELSGVSALALEPEGAVFTLRVPLSSRVALG